MNHRGGKKPEGQCNRNASCCRQFLGKSREQAALWYQLRGAQAERSGTELGVLTAGTELGVRVQKSQKARKKLGGWKRKENLFLVLYDIKNQVQKGSAGLLCPVPCFYQQAAHLMLWIYYGGFLFFSFGWLLITSLYFGDFNFLPKFIHD